MQIPWLDSQCIICLESAKMTLEHVIPKALGGALTSKFLCKDCNSRLGYAPESQAKIDPSIRRLVARLRSEIPGIAARLEEDQTYITSGPGVSVKGHIDGGNFIPHATKLPDGSLIQPTSEALKTIRKIMARQGHSDIQITCAEQQIYEAPENSKLTLAPELEMVKWSITGLQPSLNGPSLNPLIPMKAAYEFLALSVGSAIYGDAPPLQAIRRSLLEDRVDTLQVEIERLDAPDAKAFHGIVFEGNRPYAKVQLRLFGQLAFRVHFKRLSINGPRFIYTHDLASNKDTIRQLPETFSPIASYSAPR
jgi:uncharacterized protein YlaI